MLCTTIDIKLTSELRKTKSENIYFVNVMITFVRVILLSSVCDSQTAGTFGLFLQESVKHG